MRFAFSPAAIWSVVDGARCWRLARDAGDPAQPTLYKRLERWGAGLLAPVIDSVMSLFESGFGRRFRAGSLSEPRFTHDEHYLLALLEDGGATPIDRFDPTMVSTMRIALRSARIMLLSVIGDMGGTAAVRISPPLCFSVTSGPPVRAAIPISSGG